MTSKWAFLESLKFRVFFVFVFCHGSILWERNLAVPLPIINFSGCCRMLPKLDSSAVTSEVFLVSKRELQTDFFTGFGYAYGSRDRRLQPSERFSLHFLGCDEVPSLLLLLLLQLCVCVGLGRDYADRVPPPLASWKSSLPVKHTAKHLSPGPLISLFVTMWPLRSLWSYHFSAW